jgi:hypothetical protein
MNGSQVVLKGEELINPLPVANDFSWDKLVERFEHIEDVQAQQKAAADAAGEAEGNKPAETSTEEGK